LRKGKFETAAGREQNVQGEKQNSKKFSNTKSIGLISSFGLLPATRDHAQTHKK